MQQHFIVHCSTVQYQSSFEAALSWLMNIRQISCYVKEWKYMLLWLPWHFSRELGKTMTYDRISLRIFCKYKYVDFCTKLLFFQWQTDKQILSYMLQMCV